MKRLKLIALLPFLAICIASTSCESDEVIPSDGGNTQNISMNASSGATVIKNSFEIDFSESSWNSFISCDNERLRILSGIRRVHYTIVINKNNASIHLHSNTTNFKLLDEATGAIYSGNSIYNYKNEYELTSSPPYLFKESSIIVLATSGKSNNIKIKSDFYINIDKDGNITRYVNNYRADCEK
jgi:hypothetical protein